MGMTYLITGGAGFIGSHLAERLLEKGHRILAVDNLSTGRMSNIEALLSHERFQFSRACVKNEVVLDRLASEADVIVHLAASVGVERIISNPVETISNNVGGTEVVLEAALRYGSRILIASTSEVYGKGVRTPFAEDDDVLLGPTCRNRWGYAASKMVDEFLGLGYRNEYGLDVVIMRFFNTVGPRQTGQYGMVVPRFVRWALTGEPITVYGDGSQSRCFCNVSDVVTAIDGLSTHEDAPGRVYNIGSREEVTILELAERIKQIASSDSKIVTVPYNEAYEPGFEDMARRIPDTSRLNALLGWKPTLDLNTTVNQVCQEIRSELAS